MSQQCNIPSELTLKARQSINLDFLHADIIYGIKSIYMLIRYLAHLFRYRARPENLHKMAPRSFIVYVAEEVHEVMVVC